MGFACPVPNKRAFALTYICRFSRPGMHGFQISEDEKRFESSLPVQKISNLILGIFEWRLNHCFKRVSRNFTIMISFGVKCNALWVRHPELTITQAGMPVLQSCQMSTKLEVLQIFL